MRDKNLIKDIEIIKDYRQHKHNLKYSIKINNKVAARSKSIILNNALKKTACNHDI